MSNNFEVKFSQLMIGLAAVAGVGVILSSLVLPFLIASAAFILTFATFLAAGVVSLVLLKNSSKGKEWYRKFLDKRQLELDGRERALDAREEGLTSRTQQLNNPEGGLNSRVQQLNAREAKLNEYECRLNELRSQLEKEKLEFGNRLSGINAREEELNRKGDALEASILRFKGEEARIEEESERGRRELGEKENSLREAQEYLDKLGMDLSSEKEKLEEGTRNLEEVQRQLAEFAENLAKAKIQLEEEWEPSRAMDLSFFNMCRCVVDCFKDLYTSKAKGESYPAEEESKSEEDQDPYLEASGKTLKIIDDLTSNIEQTLSFLNSELSGMGSSGSHASPPFAKQRHNRKEPCINSL